MRFAVVGLKWGKNYITNLEAIGQEISFICSRNPSAVPVEFENYTHVTDYTAITIEEIDVVCICTPPKDHFEIASYFIRQGKHVIIEKPFVFSVEQATEIETLAFENGVSVLVSYQYLWNEDYIACAAKFRSSEESLVISNLSVGNATRSDYSHLWDYSSHDLAMAYGIIGLPATVTVDQLSETPDSFDYRITAGKHIINSSFSLGEKKMRRLDVKAERLSSSFEDDYRFNAVRAMLADFTQKLESGETYANIDLAITVTKTLVALENYADTAQSKKQNNG